jgi:hypothetical protein
MPRTPQRTPTQQLRSFALQLVVLAVFLAFMLGVFLPWATQYLTDAAVQQFLPPSAAPSSN